MLLKLFFIFYFFLFALEARADFFDKDVRELLKKRELNQDHFSLWMSVDDLQGLKLIDLNSKVSKMPASVSKLITTFGTLKAFSADHRFKTELYINGKINNGELLGDLIVKGGGDPSFDEHGMNSLVSAVERLKIKRITGNIIIDASLYDGVHYDASRTPHRVDFGYDAPVSAFSYMGNVLKVSVRPSKVGENARVTIRPRHSILNYKGQIKTNVGGGNSVIAERTYSEKRGYRLSLGGSIGVGHSGYDFEKNIVEPEKWAGLNLKHGLGRKKILVVGDVLVGGLAKSAKRIHTYEGRPIREILKELNKNSNNVVAEMLAKNIAAKNKKAGASVRDGVEIINKELNRLKIAKNEISFVNPAGLTQANLISSRAVVQIVDAMKKDKKLEEAFMSSLPTAGVDGTLKGRYKGTFSTEWIKAKSGYIKNVTSLAGYVKRVNGELLVFSFIYNGPVNDSRIIGVYDEIIALVSGKQFPEKERPEVPLKSDKKMSTQHKAPSK